MQDYGLVWICQCCMLVSANGECCEGWEPDDPEGIHFDREPLSRIAALSEVTGDRYSLTLGMSADEHDSNCPNHGREWSASTEYECDCETRTFSRQMCEGCNSELHGERHAAHLWKD